MQVIRSQEEVEKLINDAQRVHRFGSGENSDRLEGILETLFWLQDQSANHPLKDVKEK